MARLTKEAEKRLGEIMRETLGQRADVSMLPQEIIDAMAEGFTGVTVGELLVQKVVKLALDPKKPNQWAIQLIFDRVEGKPATASPVDDGGREIEDTLDDISRQHINQLAGQFVQHEKEEGVSAPEQETTNAAAGPASKLMDLPSHRTRRAEDSDGESGMEEGPA